MFENIRKWSPVVVRLAGLLALLFTAYWYLGVGTFLALAFFNMDVARQGPFKLGIRVLIETLAYGVAIAGIYLFPYLDPQVTHLAALILGVLGAMYYGFTLIGSLLVRA